MDLESNQWMLQLAYESLMRLWVYTWSQNISSKITLTTLVTLQWRYLADTSSPNDHHYHHQCPDKSSSQPLDTKH